MKEVLEEEEELLPVPADLEVDLRGGLDGHSPSRGPSVRRKWRDRLTSYVSASLGGGAGGRISPVLSRRNLQEGR